MLLVSYMTRMILIMTINTEYYYSYHSNESVLDIVISRKNCETRQHFEILRKIDFTWDTVA